MIRFAKYFAAVALVALLASPLLATIVVGTVKSVNADQNQFVLTDQNGRDWTIQIGQNAQIQTATNNQARIADVKAGQTVNVTYEFQNNQLVASNVRPQQGQQGALQAQQGQQRGQQAAQRDQQGQQGQQAAQRDQQGQQGQQAQHQARGKIENVNADQKQFTLKDEKGHELTFQAGRNARVQVDGKDAKLGDLQQGQEVTVSYRQVLTEIRAGDKNDATDNAQQQKSQMIRGQIQRVEEGQRQISLRDQNGKDHTFQISQNAQVQLNGRNATLADLQQGQQVTATRQMVANEIRTGRQNQNQ